MTPHSIDSLSDIAAIGADTVIDVRAPSEYAQDHVPGAINLPVLTDAERAEVGTIYKQQSPFLARKVGAALVAANAARHLQGPLADREGDWQPLVYCWRGGQRSGSFATILEQVGWRTHLIEGGYRAYRRLVTYRLYEEVLPHRLVLLDGGTGTGKTALLHRLAEAGAQILDLEDMAAHRGSLFGAISADQPAQKLFESRLAAALDRLDPAQATWVESESSRIGQRIIPPSLWSAMGRAPRIELFAPLSARAAFLERAYRDLTKDPERLMAQIDRLRPYHAKDTIARWHDLSRVRSWRDLAAGLMSEHYDPRYAKGRGRPAEQMHLDNLDDASLADAARALMARVR